MCAYLHVYPSVSSMQCVCGITCVDGSENYRSTVLSKLHSVCFEVLFSHPVMNFTHLHVLVDYL